MSKEDLNELCLTVKDMCINSIQASNMAMLSDSIHKEGLTGTLKDIIKIIEENTNE